MTSAPPTAPTLPPPRHGDGYAVALVCLGNICRSPMADVVLTDRIAATGLAGRVTVESCGTGGWHVGEPMDPRAAATLRAARFDPDRHRAQQWSPDWLDRHDLVLAMDGANLAELTRSVGPGPHDRVRRFGDFDPVTPGADVPDPFYGDEGGFEEVLAMVERTCEALTSSLATILAPAREPGGAAR